MGIGNIFKSMVDSEVLGDQIIATQEKAYRNFEKLLPEAEPHQLLANVWLSRIKASGKNIETMMMQSLAFSETRFFACVPPPDNARALGIYFVSKEAPKIFNAYPKFDMEYGLLMTPVVAAKDNGTLDELYRQYNPKMADEKNSEYSDTRGIIDAFNIEENVGIKPKAYKGPDTSLRDFPLLYLYFDYFSEINTAAGLGTIKIGRRYDIGTKQCEGILDNEALFLDYYQNNMVSIRLLDGTELCRKRELEYLDRIAHTKAKTYQDSPPPGMHLDAYAQIVAELKKTNEKIDSIIRAIQIRYGE